MIIVRVPLRISLVGGGTDLPAFYKNNQYGAVVSFAINKYIYVCVNQKFDGDIRVSYSITENVHEPEQLKHDIVRNSLKHFSIGGGLEVVSIADIPGSGTGLGSSSAFAVGLSLALQKFTKNRTNVSPQFFAETGYHIEHDLCEHTVGKQDHFASAYGGMKYYRFNDDESTIVEPINLNEKQRHFIERHAVLVYTGKSRKAAPILSRQAKNMEKDGVLGVSMRRLADKLHEYLVGGEIEDLGHYLHENWILKSSLVNGISNDKIDNLYSRAMDAGAEGGKLCGAGGSGFLFLVVHPSKRTDLLDALRLRRVSFEIEDTGATIVYGGKNE